MDLEETKLCPNCARQGQIFPNSSKRNQKLVEKVVYNQLVVITMFSDFQILALRIRRPQVRILPGVPVLSGEYRFRAVLPFLFVFLT